MSAADTADSDVQLRSGGSLVSYSATAAPEAAPCSMRLRRKDPQLTMPRPLVFSTHCAGSRQTTCTRKLVSFIRLLEGGARPALTHDGRCDFGSSRRRSRQTQLGDRDPAKAGQDAHLQESRRSLSGARAETRSWERRTLPSHPPTVKYSPLGCHSTVRTPSPTYELVDRSLLDRS